MLAQSVADEPGDPDRSGVFPREAGQPPNAFIVVDLDTSQLTSLACCSTITRQLAQRRALELGVAQLGDDGTARVGRRALESLLVI